MVLGGDNPEHREPFESFVKEYLQTGKNIILAIFSVDGKHYSCFSAAVLTFWAKQTSQPLWRLSTTELVSGYIVHPLRKSLDTFTIFIHSGRRKGAFSLTKKGSSNDWGFQGSGRLFPVYWRRRGGNYVFVVLISHSAWPLDVWVLDKPSIFFYDNCRNSRALIG